MLFDSQPRPTEQPTPLRASELPEAVRIIRGVVRPLYPYLACAMSTRVTIGALRLLGVPARPLAVHLLILNPVAVRLYQEEVPVSAWPPEACIVVTDKDLFPQVDTDLGPDVFPGHLVAVATTEDGRMLVDASLDQFTEADRNLITSPLVTHLGDTDPARDEIAYLLDSGTLVSYAPHGSAEWKQLTDWRGQHADASELIDTAVTRVTRQRDDPGRTGRRTPTRIGLEPA
ncbi:MAG: hypothetical protein J2P26_12105 [Nocardiopsaceae bacterium]|nr:hypothetical protein [Nocardiopsaceae bacterium]